MSWTTRRSRHIYANDWIRVQEDLVGRPDGQEGYYGVVHMRHPAVFVVAMDTEERVVLVEVDRYTVGRSWEVPAGGTDGEDALVAAKRELLEEAGLAADDWTHLGEMAALNGIAIAPEHVFLARGLSPAQAGQHAAEEGIRAVQRVAWSEVMEMIRDGRMTDGESVASLMYAALALGKL